LLSFSGGPQAVPDAAAAVQAAVIAPWQARIQEAIAVYNI
jgi:hypothetical protein